MATVLVYAVTPSRRSDIFVSGIDMRINNYVFAQIPAVLCPENSCLDIIFKHMDMRLENPRFAQRTYAECNKLTAYTCAPEFR